ncbi:MAG TPA: TIGR04563 family protein [Polyangia bacterium]|jgi:uncharacterized small protein (TIGR04563 family)|nr:TIGR04563 family protein [Polyangia bacterium]
MGQKPRPTNKRKHTLYFSADLLKEIGDEATRQDRSLSWIVQKAWKLSRKQIMGFASAGRTMISSKLDDPTPKRETDGHR